MVWGSVPERTVNRGHCEFSGSSEVICAVPLAPFVISLPTLGFDDQESGVRVHK